MRFTFTVEVEVERSEGRFASRDEIGGQLSEAIESADLWVPKTCATWADALQIAVGSVPRSGAGRAGLGPSGDGMIFGLWA